MYMYNSKCLKLLAIMLVGGRSASSVHDEVNIQTLHDCPFKVASSTCTEESTDSACTAGSNTFPNPAQKGVIDSLVDHAGHVANSDEQSNTFFSCPELLSFASGHDRHCIVKSSGGGSNGFIVDALNHSTFVGQNFCDILVEDILAELAFATQSVQSGGAFGNPNAFTHGDTVHVDGTITLPGHKDADGATIADANSGVNYALSDDQTGNMDVDVELPTTSDWLINGFPVVNESIINGPMSLYCGCMCNNPHDYTNYIKDTASYKQFLESDYDTIASYYNSSNNAADVMD